MATTFIWKVASLKTNPNDDNYITEAKANVFGTENEVTKAVGVTCYFLGDKASVGSDFKSIEDLKKEEGEAIIIDWIKKGIKEGKEAKLQKQIQYKIDKHNGKIAELTIEAEDTSYSAQPNITT
tara:strand:+ start:2158 stop:2529 length:372 start_codon:yes stop_codon:yes gene_type:complete